MVFDRKLKLKVEFKGKLQNEENLLRKPHFTFEGDKMIWFRGGGSVCLIDLKDLSQSEIEGVVPKGADVRFSVADFRNGNLLLYCDFEDFENLKENEIFEKNAKNRGLSNFGDHDINRRRKGGFFLIISEKNKTQRIEKLSEKFKDIDTIDALELTEDKKHGIFGSTSDRKIPNLVVVNFEENFKITVRKPLEVQNCRFVKSLAISKEKSDMIFVSTNGPFLVLGLDLIRGKVDMLKIIDIQINCMTFFFIEFFTYFGVIPLIFEILNSFKFFLGFYSDICVFNETVYLAVGDGEGEENQIIEINFNEN